MIIVIERAKQELKSMLLAIGADPEERRRLMPCPDGKCVLALDTELAGDQVVEYEGSKVLLLDIEYFKILAGKR